MSYIYRKLCVEGISFDAVNLMWFAAYLTMVNCLGDLAVMYVIDKKPYFSSQKCAQSPPMKSASTGIIVICLREL